MKSPLDRFGIEQVWQIIKNIKDVQDLVGNDLKIGFPIFSHTWTDIEDEKDILKTLEKERFIKSLMFGGDPQFRWVAFTVIDEQCEKLYQRYKEKMRDKAMGFSRLEEPVVQIKIRSIRLDEKQCALQINNGFEVISFNSIGDQDQSKAFKIISTLWNFRYEMKGNLITNKRGDTMPDRTVCEMIGVRTKSAFDKQLSRLNQRFERKGVAIRVVSKGGQCRLVVRFG